MMGPTKTIWLVLLSLYCSFATGAERFDIDGVRMGMSEAAVRKIFPAAHCQSPGKTDAFDRECTVENSGSAGNRYYFLFLEGKLVTATMRFPAAGFENALQNTQKRYGKPQMLETKNVKDRAGRQLTSAIYTWRSAQHSLILEKYSFISPTDSTLELRDAAQDDVVNERIRKRQRSSGK